MAVSIKNLENFIVCAHSKTLSAAAEKLGIAQPSLSLSIKKLETDLDQNLFLRTNEGIALSPQGIALLPEAQKIIMMFGRIKGEKTVLKYRIGCHPSVGMAVLGSFLKEMFNKRPDIEFSFLNNSSREVNKEVLNGKVHFGLIMNPHEYQGLISKTIGKDSVNVWESSSRYQNKLIYDPNMQQASSILSRWKKAPIDKTEVSNLELIGHLCESGAGFAILPSQVVKAQRLKLNKVRNTPKFIDRLNLVCYPEMIKSKEGRIIFDELKKSFSIVNI